MGAGEKRIIDGRELECPSCITSSAARQERGKRKTTLGRLRPETPLTGEESPQGETIAQIVNLDVKAGPRLLLILGTSLKIEGPTKLVMHFAEAIKCNGGKVVYVNLTAPGSQWDSLFDFWVQWEIDAWVEDLMKRTPELWAPGQGSEGIPIIVD